MPSWGSSNDPNRFTDWFHRNVKYALIGLLAVAAGAFGLVALQLGNSTQATDAIPWPAATFAVAPDDRPIVAFVGDSYTAGTGSSSQAKTFPALIGAEQGWEVVNLGRAGTGYVTSGGQAECGLDYCPTFREVIPEIVRANPSIVVVSGGRNDGAVAGLAENVMTFYRELRAALPNAKILATSPTWDDEAEPQSIADARGYVRSAAEAVGATFLDIGEPLANRPDLVGPDGIHPLDAGYAAFATAINNAIAATATP
ncbi:SGNH/GDSL hydrolase family protein [Leifsonia sp. A12D58]|uniref:SGNH/GDSL hydrolase family protein n=1 Tax=Leifsonia sp. A12D58 TaxID=3397674 RepID=UPI0039E07C5B